MQAQKGRIIYLDVSANQATLEDIQGAQYPLVPTMQTLAFSVGDAVDFYVQDGFAHLITNHTTVKTPDAPEDTAWRAQMQEEAHYGLLKWGLVGLKHSLHIKGRARRKEYWGLWLLSVGFFVAWALMELVLLGVLTGSVEEMANHILTLGSFLGTLVFGVSLTTASVRRFHDVSLSGWVYIGL